MTRAGILRLVLIGGAVAVLETASRMAWIDPVSFLPPSQMVAGAYQVLASGAYAVDIILTLKSVAVAALLAVVIGFLGGAFLFGNPRLRRVVDPLLVSYYAVPIFMFYPFFIIFFGLNRVPLIVLGFLFGIVAMIVNTLNGFERIPRALRKTARLYRLSPINEIRMIVLPASLPYFFTGIKLATVYAFIAVIAGEFILSGDGFGYQIAFAYNNFDNAKMYGLMLLLLLFVGTLNTLLYFWEQRLYKGRVRH